MYQLLNGQDITIYEQVNKQEFYIDDMLEPLWNAAISDKDKNQQIKFRRFHEIKLIDSANLLLEIVGEGKIKYLEERHEVKHAFCTYQKSIDILDYDMKVQLKEGLKLMWEWAKNQPPRDRVKWSEYELEKGIYSFWK